MTFPGDSEPAAIFDGELERVVFRRDECLRAAIKLVAKAAFGGGKQKTLVGKPGRRVDAEVEAREVADRLGADADLAIGGDGNWKRIRSARADVAHQDGGAAVDEALGQPFMQGVGE